MDCTGGSNPSICETDMTTWRNSVWEYPQPIRNYNPYPMRLIPISDILPSSIRGIAKTQLNNSLTSLWDRCPKGTNGQPCSGPGRGKCNPDNSVCMCKGGYGGSSCSLHQVGMGRANDGQAPQRGGVFMTGEGRTAYTAACYADGLPD